MEIPIYNLGECIPGHKWRNKKYFSTWQGMDWEISKPGMIYIDKNSFSRWIIDKSDGLTKTGLQKLSETVRDYACKGINNISA